jgi:hypothetical protein
VSVAVVAGAIANKHRHGGSIWVRLSWACALRELGFDVVVCEQIDPAACVDSGGRAAPVELSANLRTLASTCRAFGLDRFALVESGAGTVHGMTREELLDVCGDAALLVNISGNLRDRELLARFRHRAFVDLDPGWTQVWHANGYDAGLAGHHAYFTIAERIGRRGCGLPSAGIRWRPVRQPVVLAHWPLTPAPAEVVFTTVATWRGPFGRLAWGGREYDQKLHQFRRFAELPRRSGRRFELALDIDSADARDLVLLASNGWHIRAAAVAAGTEEFRRYVQSSAAEFSVAQGVYVDTASGWFSDRSVRYLASGRPVLVQDTGFGEQLPVGEGLLAFRTLADAVAGAERIATDYPRHAAAARRIAEEFFAPHAALAPMLEDLAVAA